ncbi:MAG TPA: TolC family protein [Williamwhitmania sp.]|nr:TolC family protein [Williamwhitmania sp.]
MIQTKFKIAVSLLSALPTLLFGQEGVKVNDISSRDTLSFEKVLQTVMESHPSLMKAADEVSIAQSKVDLAKTAYLPSFDIDASYTRLGPVTEFSIPSLGTFKMNPADNFAASLNYHQTLYDFGKTAKSVAAEKAGSVVAEGRLTQVKQGLSLQTANAYFMLVYLQKAIQIKAEEIANLEEHISFIRKKQQTGSATQYELLSTQVRLSVVKNQQVDLESMRLDRQSALNILMGNYINHYMVVGEKLPVVDISMNVDSLVGFAVDHRIEAAIAKEAIDQGSLRLKMVAATNSPKVDAFASAGGKNGYVPYLGTVKANYVAGIGISIPLFDANRTRYNKAIASSQVNELKQDYELTVRSISAEVRQNEANLEASLKKLEQSRLQVGQAEEAFSLAKVSYTAGALTNLDLLDAETAVSESKLGLLKAQVQYQLNAIQLSISLGNAIAK